MDALLSAFPEDGTPVLLLGDFNLPLETSQASAFLPLLQSFDFTLAESPSTHKAGNQLDLIFTRNCASPNITVLARISACLADISAWMSTHHLKLNLGKTELLFLPAKGSPMIDALITMEGSIVSPSQSARSLGVTLDNQLCISRHIAAITRTCRFSLYNIRRIRPFFTQEATELLVQALVISRLDYCNSLLAGLPAGAIKPLQLVQNAAAHLVFNQPKFTHVTPLLSSLHWLPIAARIRFKSLVLAFQVARGTAPPYLQSLITPYTSPRPLRSASSGKLTVPSLRAPGSRSSRSRLFSVLIPRWWNDLPQSVRTAESLAIFRKRLKTHLFRLHYH
ncbi:hypothetical protein AAFF_G00205000 [Aldrovandia affinis]|uniref:Endonuclease/exonuclease/phosphatase domain-containing protein n=1 Tax=Aldrovandia affinis TaxID=143900 RepID=A0AAD7W6C4_9TELE|nr:hypothetical protein AAFF_G00205000 [Aldrovandia affinis]